MAIYTSGIICNDAIEDRETRVLSAIRIVDHVVVDVPHPVPEGTVIVYPVPFFVVLFFKSDDPEEFDIVFTGIRPDGLRIPHPPERITTGGGTQGHTVRIRIDMDPRLWGTWWFEVSARGQVLLRLPFAVIPPNQNSGTTRQTPAASS